MIECAVSITVGVGSERHNHDTEFRSTLEHVVSGGDDVVELIPYVPYNTRINEIMKPFIERYNTRRDERYLEALDRYRRGESKNKPNRRNYAHMDYDYASTHFKTKHRHQTTGRVEEDPICRSLIIGLGDKEDRKKITRKQAVAVFSAMADAFVSAFPYFHLLGFTLHLDEEGYYHTHLDYFVAAEKEQWKQGLPVYRGQEKALRLMGYLPEQSIINPEAKEPLLFNAFRNKLYRIMEHAMDEQGLRLQYGVSRAKYPYKDPSQNMRLELWKDAQDRFVALQHYRNQGMELLCRPHMQIRDLESAVSIVREIRELVTGRKELASITLLHGYQVTTELLERYTAAATRVFEDMSARAKDCNEILDRLSRRISSLEAHKQQLCREIRGLQVVRTHEYAKAAAVNAAHSPTQPEIPVTEINQDIPYRVEYTMEEWKALIELDKQSRARNQKAPTKPRNNRDMSRD